MSASIFTTVYVAAFRPEALSYLLFIAVGPAVLALLAMPFLDAPQGKQLHSQEGRDTGLFVFLTLLGYHPIINAISTQHSTSAPLQLTWSMQSSM